MKLKLQVVLIPAALAGMPTAEIGSYKKFLHLADAQSSIGEVCDALIKRYYKLYPEAESLQIEGVQDNDRCDLDPDFAAEDVFRSGDVLRIIVDNMLPAYSLDSTILDTDLSVLLRKRSVPPEGDDTLLKRSKTIWGIRKDSLSPSAENTSPAPLQSDPVQSSPVVLPPPHQTPTVRLIPQKKVSPASKGGKRITSGMLRVPEQQVEDGKKSVFSDDEETDTSRLTNVTNDFRSKIKQVPPPSDHDDIDNGTDSDDLISNRLLKNRKRDDTFLLNNATKLVPPGAEAGKTPMKRGPLNTLTPHHVTPSQFLHNNGTLDKRDSVSVQSKVDAPPQRRVSLTGQQTQPPQTIDTSFEAVAAPMVDVPTKRIDPPTKAPPQSPVPDVITVEVVSDTSRASSVPIAAPATVPGSAQIANAAVTSVSAPSNASADTLTLQKSPTQAAAAPSLVPQPLPKPSTVPKPSKIRLQPMSPEKPIAEASVPLPIPHSTVNETEIVEKSLPPAIVAQGNTSMPESSSSSAPPTHTSPQLSKQEIMTIFRQGMKISKKITKKLAVTLPDPVAFEAAEQDRKWRLLQEQSIYENAQELESRRRLATTNTASRERNLRSRVTLSGVPNFDTNLDDPIDEAKEKEKEQRGSALPAPFNEFTSKSKLSSIFVKMKKLDARIDKLAEEAASRQVKKEPGTPVLSTVNASTNDKDESSSEESLSGDDESSESEESATPIPQLELPDVAVADSSESSAASKESSVEPEKPVDNVLTVVGPEDDDADAHLEESNSGSETQTEPTSVDQPMEVVQKEASQTVPESIAEPTSSQKPEYSSLTRRAAYAKRLAKRFEEAEVILLSSGAESASDEELKQTPTGAAVQPSQLKAIKETSQKKDAPKLQSSQVPSSNTSIASLVSTKRLSETGSGSTSKKPKLIEIDSVESTPSPSQLNLANGATSSIMTDSPLQKVMAGTKAPVTPIAKGSAAAKIATPSVPPSANLKKVTKQTPIKDVAQESVVISLTSLDSDSSDDSSHSSSDSDSEEESGAESEEESEDVSSKTSDDKEAIPEIEVDKESNENDLESSLSESSSSSESESEAGLDAEEEEKKEDEVDELGAEIEEEEEENEEEEEEEKDDGDDEEVEQVEVEVEEDEDEDEDSEDDEEDEEEGDDDEEEVEEEEGEEVEVEKVEVEEVDVEVVEEVVEEEEEASDSEESSEEAEPSTEQTPVPDGKETPKSTPNKIDIVSSSLSSESSDSDSKSDSDSSSSSDSDDSSSSDSEAEEKPVKLVKTPSLASSRLLPKRMNSLSRPVVRNVKPTPPPPVKPQEGVRTITVLTPFSKSSSDEDNSKKLKPKPVINHIRKPVLTSLTDLARRGVPDVMDKREVPSSQIKKPITKDESSSESSSSSGSDSLSDSSSDDEASSSQFVSLKKLASERKSPKKKKGGFSSLMKDARKK